MAPDFPVCLKLLAAYAAAGPESTPAGPFHGGASRQGLRETAAGSPGEGWGEGEEEAHMPFLSSGSSRLSLLIFCLKGWGGEKSFQEPQCFILFKEKGIKIFKKKKLRAKGKAFTFL